MLCVGDASLMSASRPRLVLTVRWWKDSMKSIQEMVTKLTGCPEVIGLIEYGCAQRQDKDARGDCDLFAAPAECRRMKQKLKSFRELNDPAGVTG